MNPIEPIPLRHPALQCAAGQEWPALWQDLQQAARPASWPLGDHEPCGLLAHAVPNPALAALGIDRKVARTMEKQAQLCVASAAASLRQWPGRTPEALGRTGLYLGVPCVDEEVPPLSALQRRDANQGDESWLSIMLSETPPFSGLSMLNSSAAAHVSGSFGLRGALAVFSPFCDAGLQALIEGALSVAEGENDAALIGAVSPKLHPLLPAQARHWGWSDASSAVPGEGAAFLLVGGPDETPPALRLVGYARGHVAPQTAKPEAAFANLLDQALTGAGRSVQDIGWILPASCLSQVMAERQASALAGCIGCAVQDLPIARVEQAIGILGPAEPLVHAGLAAIALASGRRLTWHAATQRHAEAPMAARSVLLTAWAPHGQCAFVLLEQGAA